MSNPAYFEKDLFTSASDYNLDSGKFASNRIASDSGKNYQKAQVSYKLTTANTGLPTDYKTFRTSSEKPVNYTHFPTAQSVNSLGQNRNNSEKNFSMMSNASNFQDNGKAI
jgi:hypothetical protein